MRYLANTIYDAIAARHNPISVSTIKGALRNWLKAIRLVAIDADRN